MTKDLEQRQRLKNFLLVLSTIIFLNSCKPKQVSATLQNQDSLTSYSTIDQTIWCFTGLGEGIIDGGDSFVEAIKSTPQLVKSLASLSWGGACSLKDNLVYGFKAIVFNDKSAENKLYLKAESRDEFIQKISTLIIEAQPLLSQYFESLGIRVSALSSERKFEFWCKVVGRVGTEIAAFVLTGKLTLKSTEAFKFLDEKYPAIRAAALAIAKRPEFATIQKIAKTEICADPVKMASTKFHERLTEVSNSAFLSMKKKYGSKIDSDAIASYIKSLKENIKVSGFGEVIAKAKNKFKQVIDEAMVPIHRPKLVQCIDVVNNTHAWEKQLIQMGAKLSEVYERTYLKILVEYKLIKFNYESSPIDFEFGRLLRIDVPPTAVKVANWATPALKHPEFVKYMEILKKMGSGVVVDTSLPFTGAGAYYSPANGLIALRPTSTWATFVHEFQHAKFDRLFSYNLGWSKLEARIKSGVKLKDLISGEDALIFDDLYLERIERLTKKGFAQLDRDAMNEALSGIEEVASISYFDPIERMSAIKYTSKYAFNALREIPNKTFLQKREYFRAFIESQTGIRVDSFELLRQIPQPSFGAIAASSIVVFSATKNGRTFYAKLLDGNWIRFSR